MPNLTSKDTDQLEELMNDLLSKHLKEDKLKNLITEATSEDLTQEKYEAGIDLLRLIRYELGTNQDGKLNKYLKIYLYECINQLLEPEHKMNRIYNLKSDIKDAFNLKLPSHGPKDRNKLAREVAL